MMRGLVPLLLLFCLHQQALAQVETLPTISEEAAVFLKSESGVYALLESDAELSFTHFYAVLTSITPVIVHYMVETYDPNTVWLVNPLFKANIKPIQEVNYIIVNVTFTPEPSVDLFSPLRIASIGVQASTISRCYMHSPEKSICGPFPPCPLDHHRITCAKCNPGEHTYDAPPGASTHRFAECAPIPKPSDDAKLILKSSNGFFGLLDTPVNPYNTMNTQYVNFFLNATNGMVVSKVSFQFALSYSVLYSMHTMWRVHPAFTFTTSFVSDKVVAVRFDSKPNDPLTAKSDEPIWIASFYLHQRRMRYWNFNYSMAFRSCLMLSINDAVNFPTSDLSSFCGPFPPCPIGTERTTCDPCPPLQSTYNVVGPLHRFAKCEDCPLTICPLCAMGSFNASNGRPPCADCRLNTYSQAEGSTSCESCPAGSYTVDPGTNSSTLCRRCPRGYTFAVVDNRLGGCTPCPPQTYTPPNITGVCVPCISNAYYSSSPLATACSLCPDGSRGSDTPCARCAPGTYSGPLMTSCQMCAAGSFSTGAAASRPCSLCAAGTFSPTPGATTCSPCSAGAYSTAAGATACIACASGSGSIEGSTSCTACSAAGTFNHIVPVFASSVMPPTFLNRSANIVVHSFLRADTPLTFAVRKPIRGVDILLIGGGGGGGGYIGSGGGAGQVILRRNYVLTPNVTYTFTVGSGGIYGTTNRGAGQGLDTSFCASASCIIASGGKGGVGMPMTTTATLPPNGGRSGSMFPGGSGFYQSLNGVATKKSGGGAGAGAKGGTATSKLCGMGGRGNASSPLFAALFGAPYMAIAVAGNATSYIAGGGAGGSNKDAFCTGGAGGGGDSTPKGGPTVSGKPSTGSGGAGMGPCSNCKGGNGASGLILIRYPFCS